MCCFLCIKKGIPFPLKKIMEKAREIKTDRESNAFDRKSNTLMSCRTLWILSRTNNHKNSRGASRTFFSGEGQFTSVETQNLKCKNSREEGVIIAISCTPSPRRIRYCTYYFSLVTACFISVKFEIGYYGRPYIIWFEPHLLLFK